MKILKPLINQFQSLLENSNIHEEIDLKISSIESFDYQINNLVKHQNHNDISDKSYYIRTKYNLLTLNKAKLDFHLQFVNMKS